MKKLLAISLFIIISGLTAFSQTLEAYKNDLSATATNVRNAPKGAVVDIIPHQSDASFILKTPKNGWWRIDGDSYEDMEDGFVYLRGSSKGYWIHYSVIAVSTRNYGGERLTLRSTPSNNGLIEFSFTDEIQLRPIDIKGRWVKVETLPGNYCGWIEQKWLCGNPVTNCN